jgi:hypothetical protein
MNKKYPNLFIVGAAKCGTTSLHHFLSTHSEINMSEIKEPHFMIREYFKSKKFNGPGDMKIISSYITNCKEYLTLFDDNKINGETSPGYFSLPQFSIAEIKNFSKDPNIIICLRNPVQRTYSAYMHKCRDGHENVKLETILQENLEEKRIMENWGWGWNYIHDSFYFETVKQFQLNFKKVKIIFFEDLISKPQNVIDEVTEFLGVTQFDVPNKIAQKNKTGLPRYIIIKKLAETIYPYIPNLISEGVKNTIKNKFVYKPQLDRETVIHLEKLFQEDIIKLGDFLKINLFKKWNINKEL